MSEIILFVFEGERTEIQIFESLERHFLKDSNIRVISFKTHIYELYKRIKEDDLGEFLEIVEVIKELPGSEDTLEGLSAQDISQVYLFFDYDGHAPEARDERLLELLTHFSEETENGKLFISYPMVEALRHITLTKGAFQSCCANIIDQGQNTSHYKRTAADEGDHCFQRFASLTSENWVYLVGENCKKANYILGNEFALPDTSVPSQNEIFLKELKEYIEPKGQVAVLSAFPLFLAEYYGVDWVKAFGTGIQLRVVRKV